MQGLAIAQLSRKNVFSTGTSLARFGYGTGRHFPYLVSDFECWGVEQATGMRRIARLSGRTRHCRVRAGRLSEVRLGRRFDIVCALGGVIAYARGRRALGHWVSTLALHTKQGGILVIDPWHFFETLPTVEPQVKVELAQGRTGRRLNIFHKTPSGSWTVYHFSIAETNGHGVDFCVPSTLRIFSPEEMLEVLNECGLSAQLSLNHDAFTKVSDETRRLGRFMDMGNDFPFRGLYVAFKSA